jgi:hypothetical protein
MASFSSKGLLEQEVRKRRAGGVLLSAGPHLWMRNDAMRSERRTGYGNKNKVES